MFWILAAGMTLLSAFAILSPLRRGRGDAVPAAAFDLRVYRDQLAEVDRDLARGVIAPDEAGRLRAEIGRKVLDADRRLREAAPAASRGAGLGAVAVLVAALAGGLALYWREGVPGAPDMPLSARIAAADAAYRARPSQAEAEARAPARPAPDLSGVDPEYLSMIEQLRAAVARNPDDPEGLALLATHEMRLGDLPAAREAQARLVELSGDAAQPTALMQLATLMIEAAGGVITPEAEALLDRALARDATLPQARYLRGVLFIQNGRPDLAFPIWRRLLEEGPESAPWIPSIREAIEELAWLAGDDGYRAPPAPEAAPLPGPDAEALAAAGALSAEDQQQMARDMVARLQGRLAEQGGTPEEWARLIAGLAVLGETEQARAILGEARQRFGQIPEAIAPIDRAATEAGLER